MKLFNSAKTHYNRTLLVTAKRTYKKYERKLKRVYLRYQGDHMAYLKKKNPNKFYHFFRQRKKNPIQGPTILNFHDHFKELSTSDSNTYPDQEFTLAETDNSAYPELNGPITTEEVTRVIKRLKKDKSPGMDNLLNEYFIAFGDYLTTYMYLVDLFNIVFSRESFPKNGQKVL